MQTTTADQRRSGAALARRAGITAVLLLCLESQAQMHGGGGYGPGYGGGGGGGGMAGTALTTFQTADFAGSGVCAMCHSGLVDGAGQDVSIDAHWDSTMMGNAAKDPLWQGKIASEVSRNPHLAATIEEKCSRCHMGMARYQAITDGTPVGVLPPGFLDGSHALNEAAMDGVSCTLCHQIQATNLGQPESFTGQYAIDTSTWAPYRLAFGPYMEPVAPPMEMHSDFSPAVGAQVRDAGLCGSCHTLYTPCVDAAGNDLGEFPEQTTYLEWQHAAAGSTGALSACQDCHMPQATGGVVISNRPWWLAPRSPFGQHHFVGGNGFMLTLLRDNAAELALTADASHFDASIARTDEQLQGRTATVSVASATIANDVLSLDLLLRNAAGHKFPSGIPARRAWLHVTVTDKRGRVLFESGAPRLTDGTITGNNADFDPSTYEPHYDLITSPDQVQIYEPIMLDSDGAVTYTLLRAFIYAKDNRLLPVGFAKATAPPDIAVEGHAAIDTNFQAGQDRVSYRLGVSGARRPLTVRAELLYQAVSRPFVEDLRRDAVPLAERFVAQYDAAAQGPRLVSSTLASVR